MSKILLTITKGCHPNMHPSQLFSDEAHLESWLKDVTPMLGGTVNRDSKSIRFGVTTENEKKEKITDWQGEGTLAAVADDFDNTPEELRAKPAAKSDTKEKK